MATPVALHAAGVAQEIYKSVFALLDIAPRDLPVKISLDTN